jgi:hypothetical protein
MGGPRFQLRGFDLITQIDRSADFADSADSTEDRARPVGDRPANVPGSTGRVSHS